MYSSEILTFFVILFVTLCVYSKIIYPYVYNNSRYMFKRCPLEVNIHVFTIRRND